MTSEVMAFDTTDVIIAVMPPRQDAPLGTLLREWRGARRISQLSLALEADVSPRHLSWIETGKSQPSRDIVMRLADTLQVPLRERNLLLLAAGYAPKYAERGLQAPELAAVHRAIEFVLCHQEPFPAFVLDRHWHIVRANPAAARLARALRGGSVHDNMLRQFFDPNDMRAVVANWEEVARDLLRHLHDQVASTPSDAVARALLDEMLRYPGVPTRWRRRELDAAPPPLLTVEFAHGVRRLRFFSTISTFATPWDVTVDELRIECTFPADDETARFCESLATEPE